MAKWHLSGLIAVAMFANVVSAAETGAPHSLVSVSQYTDVSPSNSYYGALQSLVERFGVGNGFKTSAGIAFRGGQELSRADMIMLVDGALDQAAQLAELTLMELPPEKRERAMASMQIMQGAKCKSMGAKFDSVKQIKDVSPQDPWFQAAVNLVEKWSIRIASADGKFGPSETVSVADARECLKIFSAQGPSHKPAKLTRGDFAVMLNESLEDFLAELAASNQQ